MDRKPNAFHKFLHRFAMLKPVSAALSVSLYHLDNAVARLTQGRHTITKLIGLPIIQLTTIGAKSGQPRTMPLVGIFDGKRIALIASYFGGKNNPGWYYNLIANPRCTVEIEGRAAEYVAHQAEGAEREKYWNMAVSYYRGYEMYKIRAAHRVIPVIILEPAE